VQRVVVQQVVVQPVVVLERMVSPEGRIVAAAFRSVPESSVFLAVI
jgi:hypothetical protein